MLLRSLYKHKSRRTAVGAMLALLGAALVFLSGCGGGGGGGGGNNGNAITVSGRVLRAETGLPPNPAATVTIGGRSVTTNADGTFSFTPPANATSATIAATGSMTRTLPISLSATQPNDLGDVYISDTGYGATVTGRVVATVSGQNQPVGNAKVTLAGITVTTAADGTFKIDGLPEGLGNVAGTFGKVTATGFEDKPITDVNLQFPLAKGSNPIGDLLIATPSGSVPLPPYTIKGLVQVGGKPQSGITVTLSNTTTTLGSTTTDATGTYTFWVVPATYTISAANGGATQMTTVILMRLDTPVNASTLNF